MITMIKIKHFRQFLIVAFVCGFTNSYALFGVELFGILLKPYVGIDTLHDFSIDNKNTSLNGTNDSVLEDAFKLDNIGGNVGLRIHRNFGIEYSLSSIDTRFLGVARSFDIETKAINLYIPLFDILGTSIEIYGNVNNTNVDLGSVSDSVTGYGYGLQARFLGIFAVTVGHEILPNVNLNQLGGKTDLEYTKIGFKIFFA